MSTSLGFRQPSRKEQDFYDRCVRTNLRLFWEVLKGPVPPEPKSRAVPYQWKYGEIRPLLLESGSLLTAEEASSRAGVGKPIVPG